MRFYSQNKSYPSHNSSAEAGFTLLEVMVVAVLIGFLSTLLITNFSKSRVALQGSAQVLMATIREAQSKAVSSKVYGSTNPCGYGIHYVDSTHYAIYVGPDASGGSCSGTNKNYQVGEDTIVSTYTFQSSTIEFLAPFNDIFFEPPQPKTYINNDSSLAIAPEEISIHVQSGSCPTDCKSIYVYTSGRIDTQ